MSEMEGHDNTSSSVVGATLVLGPLMYCHDPDVDQVKEATLGQFMVSAQETGQPTLSGGRCLSRRLRIWTTNYCNPMAMGMAMAMAM